MNLIAWFKNKSWTSHTVAAAAIAVATIISTDPMVRDFVMSLFKAHPSIGVDVIALAAIILKYTHSSSPAGTVANAKVILSEPDAPTTADINAASTKL